MATYRVVEKFISINGEGTRAGQLAVFIRFAGCNLDCNYCDTKWANEPDAQYTEMTEFEIYDYIKSTGVKNVTLTGGEPLLRESIDKLLRILSSDKTIRVEIETNGSVGLAPFREISENISFTVDYKLPGSGMESMMDCENYEELTMSDTVKFVVSHGDDLQKAKDIINELDDKKKVLDEAINEAKESKKRYEMLILEARKMIDEYRKMYEYFGK